MDLSTTRTGIALAPLDWSGEWRRVELLTLTPAFRGGGEDGRILAMAEMATRIVAELKRVAVTDVFIESYAYSSKTNATRAGEFGGIVRLELLRSAPNASIDVANQSAARKLLLGKATRGEEKIQVANALIASGCPRQEHFDPYDAFCCLNWGMSELGGYCLIGEENGK